MKNNLSTYLNETRLKEIIDEVAHQNPQVIYSSGPLNKNDETTLFENIIKDLIADARDGSSNKIKLEVANNEAFLIRGGVSINSNELLNKVNFNHLAISEKDISDYSQHVGSKLSKTDDAGYKRLLDFHYIENPDSKEKEYLSQLSLGEKRAIEIYSGNTYKEINAVLRGQTVVKSIKPGVVFESLMHAAVAAHGLNKAPDVELPRVVRIQDDYQLNELIENAMQHKVTQESAFISTADQFSEFAPTLFNGNVRVIYENVRGKKVAALSIAPENEYLIPPSTQIKWTGHKEENGIHYFTAQGANVLLEKPIAVRVVEAVQQIEGYIAEVGITIKNDVNLPLNVGDIKSPSVNTIKDTVDNKDKLQPNARKAQIQPEEFIERVVEIIDDNMLADKSKVDEYKSGKGVKQDNSKYNKDSQQFTKSIDNSYLDLKTKLYNLVGNIINNLGIKALGNYFLDKAKDIQKQALNEKKSYPSDKANEQKLMNPESKGHTR